MKIIIVGNGKVGYAIASQLAGEHHDIVMVDDNAVALQRAENALDVMCIEGNGASIRVFSHLTESIQKEIDKVLESDTGKFSNETYLADLNGRLSMKHSFLVVRKAENLLFVGDTATVEELKQEFFGYEDAAAPSSWRNFLDKDT